MKTNDYRTLRLAALLLASLPGMSAMATLKQKPLYLGYGAAPMMLLTMQRDHRLFNAAYDNISDNDGDGVIDTRYKPNKADGSGYYGYFDSGKCYTYNGSYFVPDSFTSNKKCSTKWSGDFLNYLTMTRMDTLRRVLYGGKRSTDNGPTNSPAGQTIIERAYIPQEAHMFGIEYTSEAVDGFKISDYTPLAQPATNTRHLFANLTEGISTANKPPLLRVVLGVDSAYHLWDWLSREVSMGGTTIGVGANPSITVSKTDYNVRVEVCKTGLLEKQPDECRPYPTGTFKPVGILHHYGQNDEMSFGLITGSYTKNLSGGVLRRGVGPFQEEIISATGQFRPLTGTNSFKGIVATINAIVINDYKGIGSNYGCSSSSNCLWWGNPVAEMMYEGLRYFAGAAVPTLTFTYTDAAGSKDYDLKVPLAQTEKSGAWNNPYTSSNWCAKPFQTVISDTMPTFDSDNLPGNAFSGTVATTLTLGSLNVSSSVDAIWNDEYGTLPRNIIIGETLTKTDQLPTPKETSGFSTLRGLTPEDPNKQGSYYVAAVAAYGKTTDLNSVQGSQKVTTFAIALSGTTPKIEVPVKAINASGVEVDQKVVIVPFGKTVSTGGRSDTEPAAPARSNGLLTAPYNTGILRMYVESIKNVPPFTTANVQDMTDNNGNPHYRLRVVYADTEYGADYDMDALAVYDVKLRKDSNNHDIVDVMISVDPSKSIDERGYAVAGYLMHLGYIISGTQNDGAKLLVRNPNNSPDVRYDLDGDCATDPDPVGCSKWNYSKNGHIVKFKGPTAGDSSPTAATYKNSLPFIRTITYTPKAPPTPAPPGQPPTPVSDGEFIKYDPLWYAAKWGGFLDGYVKDIDAVVPSRQNGVLDSGEEYGEWEKRDALGNIIKDQFGNAKEPRTYFPVTNAGTLKDVLDKAFEAAVDTTSASSAAATNAVSVKTPNKIYQAKFEPRYWTGRLIAYPIDIATGDIDTSTSIFDAAQKMPAEANRKIYSYRPDEPKGGFEFLWDSFSVTEKGYLNSGSSNDQQAALYYLRGQRKWDGCTPKPCKSEASGDFRKRNADPIAALIDKPVLGDMINSAPVFVGSEDLGYGALSGYSSFVSTVKSLRTPSGGEMVYIGANDGMMHAFDANTGVEIFSYIPRAVFGGFDDANPLSLLTGKPAGTLEGHKYYVDGPTTVSDAYLDGKWKSILVGTLGGGGKAVYALDVTKPTTDFGNSNVLWEFSHPELGFVTGQPLIVQLKDKHWYAIMGNGYESKTCSTEETPRYKAADTGLPICTVPLDVRNAKLFIIRLDPKLDDGGWDIGSDYFVIHATDEQTEPANYSALIDNALSAPGGFRKTRRGTVGMTGDIDDDLITDVLYAGDMQGNLWRFDLRQLDLTTATPSSGVARSIFQAKDSSGTAQPISAPPIVMENNQTGGAGSGYMVLFGTGRYVYADTAPTPYADDPADKNTQSLYGIWDNPSDPSWSVDGRPDPTQLKKLTVEYVAGYGYIHDETIAWTGNPADSTALVERGWYLDLILPTGAKGERQIDPGELMGGGRVLFVTKIPSTDACSEGGSSRPVLMDATSGGMKDKKTFDTNGDRLVDAKDQHVTNPITGEEKYANILPDVPMSKPIPGSNPPMCVPGKSYCNDAKTLLITPLSCTNGTLTTLKVAVVDPKEECGASGFNRTSWRELQ